MGTWRVIRGLAMAGAGVVALTAQTSAPIKMVDIGADKVPLSDKAREELAKAVGAHDYAAERATLLREIGANPMAVDLRLLLGRLAYLERQPRDAADDLDKADRLKPLNEGDRMTMALAFQFSSRIDRARVELEKLTKIAPTNAEYFYLLGRVDRLNQRYEDAIAEYRKSIALSPDTLKTYEDLGRVLEETSATDEARKIYEEAVRRDRLLSNGARWEWSPLDLGMLVEKSGDLDGAEALIRESLRYKLQFSEGHYQLAALLQKKGKDGEAIPSFVRALQLNPGFRQAWLALGRSYTRMGQTAEAEHALAMFKKLTDAEDKALGKNAK